MSHPYTDWYLLTRPQSSLVFLVSGYRTVAGDLERHLGERDDGKDIALFLSFPATSLTSVFNKEEKCAVRLS